MLHINIFTQMYREGVLIYIIITIYHMIIYTIYVRVRASNNPNLVRTHVESIIASAIFMSICFYHN